jgi:hypothetical protein
MSLHSCWKHHRDLFAWCSVTGPHWQASQVRADCELDRHSIQTVVFSATRGMQDAGAGRGAGAVSWCFSPPWHTVVWVTLQAIPQKLRLNKRSGWAVLLGTWRPSASAPWAPPATPQPAPRRR